MPYLEFSTALAEASWENCLHETWHRAGFRQGKQLWRCALCHKCQLERRRYRTPEQMMRALAPFFAAKQTTGAASAATGIHSQTVRSYYQKFMKFKPTNHVCGKPMLHLGKCPKVIVPAETHPGA